MSIPRAKIKTEASVVSAFSAAILGLGDKPRQMSSWYYRCTECGGRGDSWIHWENAADEATEHLREAHGVRTVGSLTAKDIGSWIEMGWHTFEIRGVRHSRESVWVDGTDRNENPEGFSRMPSTLCRVTEAKP